MFSGYVCLLCDAKPTTISCGSNGLKRCLAAMDSSAAWQQWTQALPLLIAALSS